MLIKLILLLLLFSCSFKNNKEGIKDSRVPVVLTKSIYSYTDDIFNVSIDYRIPYNNFVFSKQKDSFKASLLIISQIYDINNDSIIIQESWPIDINIDLDKYQKTKSEEFQSLFFKKDIKVNEGEYDLIINIKDLDNEYTINANKILSLSSSKGLGEIILFSEGKEIDSKLSLGNNNITIHFQYFEDKIDKLIVEAINNDNTHTQSYSDIKLDDDFYKINFSIPEGYYGDIELVLSLSDYEKSKKINLYDSNAVLWSNNVKQVVGPMGYILPPSEIRALETLNDKEKIDFVVHYWKDKDPNKDTEKNELLIEFSNRFNFANENLSDITGSGWSTHRGEIYMIYGEPESTDTYSNRQDNTVVEVWKYPSGFEFVFENKFGSFILVRKSII